MTIGEAIEELGNVNNVRFERLLVICKYFFGDYRNKGSSHHIFKVPWSGDPRINLQKDGNKAKSYQVRQVIKCLEKLEELHNEHP